MTIVGPVKRMCLSRRRALGALPVGALGVCGLAGCGGAAEPTINALDARDGIPLSEIPENQTTLLDFGDQRPFAVAIRGSGEDIRVLSAYCTHNGCAVALQGKVLHCPCHGSEFDAATGAVLSGPAATDLPEIPVEVNNGVLRRV